MGGMAGTDTSALTMQPKPLYAPAVPLKGPARSTLLPTTGIGGGLKAEHLSIFSLMTADTGPVGVPPSLPWPTRYVPGQEQEQAAGQGQVWTEEEAQEQAEAWAQAQAHVQPHPPSGGGGGGTW